jgi:4-nitrophenyl phosphatase
MSLRGVILDLDGTVYVGGSVVDGVHEGIEAIRDAGLDVLFFSNNPVMSGEAYVEYLGDLGVDARAGEACSAGDVTVTQLCERHAEDSIFLIGSDGLREQLRDAGLTLTDDPDDCEVLVVSWTPEFDYEDMCDALAAVDAETPLYGTDPDRTFQRSTDELLPGSGAVIGAVSVTVDRDPEAFFGKPSAAARAFAVSKLDVPAEECLIVGDRLDTDLELGLQAGMTTALVRSGVTGRDAAAASDIQPDYVLDNLGEVDRVLDEEL